MIARIYPIRYLNIERDMDWVEISERKISTIILADKGLNSWNFKL